MTAHRRTPRKRTIRDGRTGTVADALGPITTGVEVFALTHGQFSLIDALVYLSQQIGPCDLTVSTWTAGHDDLSYMADLLSRGTFRSVRFLVDRSFITRQPDYCKKLRELFGDESIRTTRTHAKFAILRNDRFALAVRTSMNLNSNPRSENIEVSDDTGLADFLESEVEQYFAEQAPGTFNAEIRNAPPSSVTAGQASGRRLYTKRTP